MSNRAARRRGERARKTDRRFWIALGAIGAIFIAGAAALLYIARDTESSSDLVTGDDATPAIRTPSTGGTKGGPEPRLDGPAVKFAAAEQEIGGGVEAVPNESADLTSEMFADASIGPFKDANEGRAKVQEWGYKEGYLGVFQPDGLAAGLLLGRYYVRLETHLFNSVDGAIKAFAWYSDTYNKNTALQAQQTPQLANQSAAWKSVQGKIESSDLDGVYHRFVFRRGNLIGIVQTAGADTFMTVDPARDIAVIVDDRALGNRAAPTPTPSGGALPPTPTR